MGNVGHIALKVNNIEESFDFIKKQDVKLISDHIDYRPYQISSITADEFYFFDKEKENNNILKQETCKIIGSIKYFYFVDRYGIQWELEQGHSDL